VTEDLHPYDGRERRFRFDNETRERGRAIVARVLKLPVVPHGARFELSFYSGGIGIFDNVAIAIPATRDEAVRIAAVNGFAGPDETDHDLVHLVQDEDAPLPFDTALAEFIARKRAAFQPDFVAGAAVWIEPGSGINSWNVMWHADGELAYLGYDQG
jgi:hypothetical protein